MGDFISAGGEVDTASQYTWRGLTWSEGPVMQPSAWASVGDFTFSCWSNFVLNNEPNQGQFNEVDLGLNYGLNLNGILLEPHLEYWTYPNQTNSPSTSEASLKVSYPFSDSFSLSTNHAFDVKEYLGSYFGEVGLIYETEFLDILMETSLSLGWASSKFNETYVGVQKNAFNVVKAGAAATYYLIDYLYLKPHAEVSTLPDDKLAKQVEDRTVISGGLYLGTEF